MENTAHRAIAIVGLGAVLPDAVDVAAFWQNVRTGRYSITEVAPDRWDPEKYYDPDPNAPDKTYSKIGGWVREFTWDPIKWRLPIPPRVVNAMDEAQKWAVACTREALEDFGYPERPLDANRTAVILGNAMAGEKHYLTSLRIYFPEYAQQLSESASFAALAPALRRDITRELHQRIAARLPEITEDSMPGELANCIPGRIANLFNFHGPNYVVDAACASAMAAINAAAEGLLEHDFDTAITGGVDRNMGAPTFTKFCKIGALSATGTRPYAEGADGFVMGEGTAIFLMKRLADAERDGDKIYAVLRGMGGSSDGKGKGITAPNPIGQKLCLERAWQNAGLSPSSATYFEGHGTSTRVGDVVEVESLAGVLRASNGNPGPIALGSVKSNIGHLKGAAGAAGFLKTVLALHDKVLPPSVHCERPNPDIDFAHCPLQVNTELRPWEISSDGVRCAGLSAFGFGGTNFHAVLEEYIPHRLNGNGNKSVAVGEAPAAAPGKKAPLRGALVLGAPTEPALVDRLRAVQKDAAAGSTPVPAAPADADLRAAERIAIDYADAADLADKSAKALKAMATNQPAMWKALRAQGVFRGKGPAPKVAFLYTGQGSQYVNMMRDLRDAEPLIARTFTEADSVLTPLLGKPLSHFIFVDETNPSAVSKAEDDLRQTAITQPAVLATDLALTRLLAAYGIQPDMAMGHSLGEYGALVASGGLPFADALEAVSARGREMTRVSMADNGRMAAIFAPLPEVEHILQSVSGYVVIANINSDRQAVIGGASQAVDEAVQLFLKAGFNAVPLPVSHAFHTSIVAPASEPLRRTLERLHLESPRLPVVTNVTGEFYPTGSGATPQMLDILAQQIASPVQFVKGLRTLYQAGARVFVEVGPKKALHGFVEDVLGENSDVLALFTNHPKVGDLASFNQALCGLYAAGLGSSAAKPEEATAAVRAFVPDDRFTALSRLFTDFIERGREVYEGGATPRAAKPVTVTGTSLGLPGCERLFDDANYPRMLRGEQFIDVIPTRIRRAILDKHITRLVKSDNGGPTFETIGNVADVIKLAGRGGDFAIEKEFGLSADRTAALDRVTSLAIAAGLEALRDAGIPLVMHYKTTSKGTQLPDRWGLPDAMRDDTGVIFACCFPGLDSFADEISRYHEDRARREQLALLEDLRGRMQDGGSRSVAVQEMDRRIAELQAAIDKESFVFDRRFMFRILSMGHSQFAEYIGARGPNTQLNSACASTTQAMSLAEDWIAGGRCRRVIILSSDDVTTDRLLPWVGSGFLASGAAATDEVVEEAALPFDRRRHGMLLGMGAAALVIESADAARERGLRPICEVLSTVTANSAFHGTRLDVQHICQVMEALVAKAEARCGVSRQQMAESMVFVSHETYTPARGGSASAEINALRRVFGEAAGRIVIGNTKGFTGHAMGAGIEEVVAVRALETGCVPPVANFKEVDPELGVLNLSKGGMYPVEFALRLGAGFGSQISMSLMRWVTAKDGRRASPQALGFAGRIEDQSAWTGWLGRISGQPAAELEVVHRTLRVRDQRVARPVAEAPAAEPVATPVFAPPPARVTAPPEPVVDAVEMRVLELAVAKTGYPREMLDLDLDLEADLGIDTVKQAEMFAAIREIYNIPRDEKRRLRDFPTLAHVIRFVRENTEAAAPAPAAAPAAPAPAADSVEARVLELAVAKTGYPREMLDLDLDLEADLGIDTVKQAEMFAAVREIYNIPRDEKRRLRDFPTLAHVIRFVHENTAAAPLDPAPAPTTAAKPATDPVLERVLELAVSKTGYPREMLDLDLDLEADLGIDTVKQAEMFAAIREIYQIPRDENRRLRDFPTLAHVVRFVHDSTKPAPATAAAPAAARDHIADAVLEIVAAKTGYPLEMLDLDLDLEADLGIDTVKQAETFASVRAAFNIPRNETLKLRDFPTLAHVIQFARDRQPHAEEATSAPAREAPAARPEPLPLEAANDVPRRVPTPVLRPPLSLCKPTGVTLAAGSRVIVMPDHDGAAAALVERLQSAGVETLLIEGTPHAGELAAKVNNWLAGGPVHGVFWLPALDDEGDVAGMDLAFWREALRVRVKLLYSTMRAVYEQPAVPDGAFLVSATRLGGLHGYDDAGASMPLGGAVAGFAKTYKRERTAALVKTVDFAPDCDPFEIAGLLVDETLRDPGAVEIGYHGGLRWTISVREQPAADGNPGMDLNKDTVFLITGAAGSIVSAITADLAAASGGTFYLLDLVPEPDPNSSDLQRFTLDKDGLRKDLYDRIKASGKRATPALVEKEMEALERAKAAQSSIYAVRAAGGTAHYFSVNMLDAEAVTRVIEQVRERSGRIDVLLHAAGLEHSRFLPDKPPQEFDLVFDVKSDGWFNLLHSIGDMPLGATVAFSSVAGRFGNAGQSDYSSANDLLCKITSSFRTARPATRGIVIDWTAWGGIGMATRGSIPKMMELAGIDMLAPEAGIPLIRRELTEGRTRGEVVVARRLGVLLNEWDATGGLDLTAAADSAAERGVARGPMLGRVVGAGIHSGLTIETTLDPTVQPFLFDHQIEGRPVLPGVMGIEAFAEAAQWMLPGWHLAAVEDVDFLAPFKLYRNEPRTATIQAVFSTGGNDGVVADCRLTGSRSLPNQTEPQVTTHFTACVRLTRQVATASQSSLPNAPDGVTVQAQDIYRLYFHGPAYQVMDGAWSDSGLVMGRLADNLPIHHYPPELPTLMAPRCMELCLQTAGIWDMASFGRMALPNHIERVSLMRPTEVTEGPLYAVVTPRTGGSAFDAEVVDAAGNRYLQLTGYSTVAHPDGVDAEQLRTLQEALSADKAAAASAAD